MKKLIAVITSILLILTMVSGCTRNENTPETPPTTETPPADNTPVTPPAEEGGEGGFTDGTFNAEGEADERGWKPKIEIVVENGEITEANYDEVNEEGNLKSEDQEYAKSMSGQSGVTPAEAYQQLEDSLIETQDPDQVDTVSGATSSSDKFIELAKEALTTNP
jgi:major membrane immunogen (membrane-anchored lipoprotein)